VSIPSDKLIVKWDLMPAQASPTCSPGTRQDLLGQGDHLGLGQSHSGCAQAVDRPRAIRLVNHQQGAIAAVVGAAPLGLNPATLAL
jgi:hypothetical protein